MRADPLTPDRDAQPTTRAVFDRVNSEMGMVHELRKVVRDAPALGHDTTADQRTAWLRHVIEICRLADVRVRPSRPETWAQAFERVCGEVL